MTGDPWTEYVVLTRDCLHDVRDPITRHDQLQALKSECIQRLDSQPDMELGHMVCHNIRGTDADLLARLDFALRIMSRVSEETFDPLDVVPHTPALYNPGIGPRQREPSALVVGQCHSVSAAWLHRQYRISLEGLKLAAGFGDDFRHRVPMTLRFLVRAADHARKAAAVQFFSRAVGMVGVDFRDLARALDIDLVCADTRYAALWSAADAFEAQANLDEMSIMVDDPEAGFSPPACASPTCAGNSRTRRPELRLVPCTNGCSESLHVTYCNLECLNEDYFRHVRAKHEFEFKLPEVLADEETRTVLKNIIFIE